MGVYFTGGLVLYGFFRDKGWVAILVGCTRPVGVAAFFFFLDILLASAESRFRASSTSALPLTLAVELSFGIGFDRHINP